MDISLDTLWKRVLEVMKTQVSRPAYETWIRSTAPEELTPEALTIRVLHPFARSWLTRYYATSINQTVADILGYPVEIRVLTSPKEQEENIVSVPIVPIEPPSDPKHPCLNPKYSFSKFVVGSTNRMPHAASLAVAEAPGREFNPLFLCGGVGLGKTHLMQAIAHYRLEISPKDKIAYVSTEQFTNDLITAIRKDSMQVFREQYRAIDMILVDDIQFIEGKEYTQEEFFHTFNALYETGKQIVLASDRPPGQIPRLQERLCSRFSMGLIADIQVPDLETRMAILQKKAEQDNLKIPPDVIHYIAASYTSNIRELEGALVRAVAYISISGLPMTVSNVAPVLNPPKEPIEVSAEVIFSTVTAELKVNLEDLLGNSRRREISYARQIAMYLMRQHTNLSLPKIGEAFGGKDHTTVMYSCEKIAQQQIKDVELSQTLKLLNDRIYIQAQSLEASGN